MEYFKWIRNSQGSGNVFSVVAVRSSALDSSYGVVRMWVRIQAWPVAALVSLSKTLNRNCFVLRMRRKAAGPVCCVMHVKEPRTLIVKEKGLALVFLDLRLEHPAGWICARYKSSVLLLLLVTSHWLRPAWNFKMVAMVSFFNVMLLFWIWLDKSCAAKM